LSKKNPTFRPRYYTIKQLERLGVRIHSVDQYNKWAVIKTEGEFHTMGADKKSPYNEWGDHMVLHSVSIKIRMA